MSFVSEFKQFALKGNVMDLAVGVIIGAAFGKIVDSVVNDLIMPLVARLLGKIDFANMFFALQEIPPNIPMTLDAIKKAGIPVFAYGSFLTVALNFFLLAVIIFIMIRQVNRLRSEEPAPVPAATPEDILLLRDIRDSLKK